MKIGCFIYPVATALYGTATPLPILRNDQRHAARLFENTRS